MLGVFDSGVGGLGVLAALRRLCPTADIAYFADTRGAPYGTKPREVLLSLIEHDIDRLRAHGASRVLIGCCTASTLYPDLPPAYRKRTTEIVGACATAALAAGHRKIAVLGTEATVRSHAFRTALVTRSPVVTVTEVAAQPLVALAEEGRTSLSDPALARVLGDVLTPVALSGAGTLILGCTHFPVFRDAIAACLPGVTLISSSDEGARSFAGTLSAKDRKGNGTTLFL